MAGVMVILQQLHPVGKTAGHLHFYFVLRLVLPVTATALRFPILHAGERLFTRQLFYIVGDSVFIAEIPRFKAFSHLIAEYKQQSRIDDRLPLEHLCIIFHWNINIRKYI